MAQNFLVPVTHIFANMSGPKYRLKVSTIKFGFVPNSRGRRSPGTKSKFDHLENDEKPDLNETACKALKHVRPLLGLLSDHRLGQGACRPLDALLDLLQGSILPNL